MTPCFMPCATRGVVKSLDARDLHELSFEIALANTYHLVARPGMEVVRGLGGVAGFMGFKGLVLTDSGGYQVMSLSPKVDDDGVTFKSTYDGAAIRFTPEEATRLQEGLGSDIAMVLDICPELPGTRAAVQYAMQTSLEWAKRAREVKQSGTQAQFGIVQGGVDIEMRRVSASNTAAIGFEGYGIGGLSVGEPRYEMLPALEAAVRELPEERPRYLMGVGDPISIVEAVARGVDMFDCVLPTRLARHGTALCSFGKLHLKNAAHSRSELPLDPSCECQVCQGFSRGYLRHLLTVGEMSAARLVSFHNLAFMKGLMVRVREAVFSSQLPDLIAEIRSVWDDGRG